MAVTKQFVGVSVLLIIAIASLVFLIFQLLFMPADDSLNRNFCRPEQREPGACIEIYQPVCGWYDPAKILCVRYPCASTFSNSCFACMDTKVLYWTEGECPE